MATSRPTRIEWLTRSAAAVQVEACHGRGLNTYCFAPLEARHSSVARSRCAVTRPRASLLAETRDDVPGVGPIWKSIGTISSTVVVSIHGSSAHQDARAVIDSVSSGEPGAGVAQQGGVEGAIGRRASKSICTISTRAGRRCQRSREPPRQRGPQEMRHRSPRFGPRPSGPRLVRRGAADGVSAR